MLAAVPDDLQISNQRGDSGKRRVWKKVVDAGLGELISFVFNAIFVRRQYVKLR